ncbi:hypothetical protein ABPG75_011905 [Micractinium tetrahymenae]
MSHPVWDGGSGSAGAACCHPEVSFNSAASILKDEDVLLIEHQRPWPTCNMGCEAAIAENASSSGGNARCGSCGAATDEYSLFAVFDGHNGVAAARMAADAVLGVLEARLPPGPPPPCDAPGFLPWREDVQLALVETLAELNKMFALKGILAGCTATLVLQMGWLLTVANLGDSRALLDTGVQSHMLTVDHRVATHKGERRRVEAMGNTIAPIDFSGSGPATRVDHGIGPLRIWPGGLCLSRAIGDFDVGDAVIPFPHVMQVMVPPTGARLLVASDGVWDAYEKMNRIGSMLRTWSLDSSPQRLIQSIVRAYGGLRDDTTLVTADIVPPGKTFAECAAAVAQRAKAAASAAHHSNGSGGGGGLGGCGCFGSAPAAAPAPAPPAEPAVPSAAAVAQLEVLADVDVAAVMGLMPGATPTVPGWYDEYVGEQLFALAAEAMEAWQEAHERRTGRRPATPPLESSVRAARAAKEALRTGEAEPLVDAHGAAWEPAAGGGMRRSASTFFSGAVAEGDDDYAAKFGHYKGYKPAETPSSGSPGSSGGLSAGDSAHSGRPEGSVRSGGYRYGDASVRAGSRFAGDASVRAGRYGNGDVSVRAGSRMLGDPSVRAGAAYYAGGNGSGHGSGGSGHGQHHGGSRSFRADPSIRAGAAFFKSHPTARSDGAAAAERSAPAAAAPGAQQAPQPPRASLEVPASMAAAPAAKHRAEGEEGRQHGRRGGGAAGAALAAAASGEAAAAAGLSKNGPAAPAGASRGSGGASCASASGTAPIPVPRSVAFGGVTVVGGSGRGFLAGDSARELQLGKGGASLEDSPNDHASMLRQTSSANSSSVLGTIAEG